VRARLLLSERELDLVFQILGVSNQKIQIKTYPTQSEYEKVLLVKPADTFQNYGKVAKNNFARLDIEFHRENEVEYQINDHSSNKKDCFITQLDIIEEFLNKLFIMLEDSCFRS